MKCAICGEEIIKGEHDTFVGGSLTITFGYGSKHDTEIWVGEVHDSCVRILEKFVVKKSYP